MNQAALGPPVTLNPPIGFGRSPWGLGSGVGRVRTLVGGVASPSGRLRGRVGAGPNWWHGVLARAVVGRAVNAACYLTSTTARRLASDVLNCSAHGQWVGRCRVCLRPERVMRPGTRQMVAAERAGLDERLAEPDACGPPGHVVGDHVQREPCGVGAETARREVVEPDPVLEVADRVLDLGVAAVVGFELDGPALPVGDDRRGSVPVGEQRELGARRAASPV